MTYIKREVIKRTRNTIKGYFCLSDKTKTIFDINKDGWEQWGNTSENLYLTVGRLEKLQEELFK